MGLFDNPLGKAGSFSDLRKYIDDFEIAEEKDRKGNTHKVAVYKGLWTVLRNWTPTVRFRLWCMTGLSLTTVGLYVWMMLLTHLFSGNHLVVIPLLAGMFPCLYLLMGSFCLPYKGKPMRRDQFMHSFIRISRSCVGICSLTTVSFSVSVILRLIQGNWSFFNEDWYFMILCLVVIVTTLGIISFQRSFEVTERDNSYYHGVL